MRLILATDNDSERLKEYYSRQSLTGKLQISVHRQGSFFDKYRQQSDDFDTFLLLDDKEEIHGTATLIYREAYLNGQKQVIGYATDLRISPNRSAVLYWAQLYLSAFQQSKERRNCQYVFSSVEHHSSQAYNALIRPRHSRRHLPRYFLFRKFYVVGIHGRWPWSPSPLRSVRVDWASENDLSELIEYLGRKRSEKILYFPLSESELLKRLKTWPGLDITDFLVARNAEGNIVGCTALWNGDKVERLRVENYHGQAATAYQLLNLGRFMGLTRPLPAPGQFLKFRFLSQLNTDNPDVFYTILCEALRRTRKDEFLLYNSYRGDYAYRPPRSFISTIIPYGLYTILLPDQELPESLHPNPWTIPPDFEIAEM